MLSLSYQQVGQGSQDLHTLPCKDSCCTRYHGKQTSGTEGQKIKPGKTAKSKAAPNAAMQNGQKGGTAGGAMQAKVEHAVLLEPCLKDLQAVSLL